MSTTPPRPKLGIRSWQAALAVLVLAGCGESMQCNAAMFHDFLGIRLERPTWEPGKYRFELRSGDARDSCTLAVESGASTFASEDCLADEQPDGDPRVVGLVEGSSVVFQFQGRLETVQIDITRDGEPFHSETLRPSYDQDEPNGDGCGFRFFAIEVVRVP
jgi:hypothetical protein